MKLKDGYVLRNVAGMNVVVSTKTQVDSFNGMITMNETAVFFWKDLEAGKTREEILAHLLEEYEVAPATAEEDLDAFLNKLKENGILEA